MHDSNSLYEVLENDVIPLYYARNQFNLPEEWIRFMKKSIAAITPHYNSHRMMKEYSEKLYIPAAQKYFQVINNNFEKARSIATWKESVRARFASLHIKSLSIEGAKDDRLNVKDSLTIQLKVDRGKIEKTEIRPEAVIIYDTRSENSTHTGQRLYYNDDIIYVPFELVEETESLLTYKGIFTAKKCGKVNYGIRIMPTHPDVDDIYDLNCIYWA
jgi:hypothetical protein